MNKPPLTFEQLHDIGQRRKGDADVKALLWEIKRLRDENERLTKDGQRDYGIISRCYQISRSIPESWKGGVIGTLMDDLKKQLEGHPVRKYQDGIMPALRGYDTTTKPGDDD